MTEATASSPRAAARGRVWILSDIDGTLVPHPYFSGLAVEERARYVERVAALFPHPRFGLVTGRTRAGFERLLTDSGLAISHPLLLGLEFGAHLFERGEPVAVWPTYEPLHALLTELEAELRPRLEFEVKDDILTRMRRGKMEGFVIEPKACIAQVEWYFDRSATQEAFGHFLRDWLNPRLLSSPTLGVQLFPDRIDLLERGFVPKAGVLPRLGARQGAIFGGADSADTLVALGDELYDSYMFADLKARATRGDSPFARVECYAVGRNLPHADACFASIEEALGQVERWLSE